MGYWEGEVRSRDVSVRLCSDLTLSGHLHLAAAPSARACCSSPERNGSKRPVRPFSSRSRFSASCAFASSGVNLYFRYTAALNQQ